MLTYEDIDQVRQLKQELQARWFVAKKDSGPTPSYKHWREEQLNKLQQTNHWGEDTRRLYASMLSAHKLVHTWHQP